jgi:nicotinamide-nucleotide amidase
VISELAAQEMAIGVSQALESDVGLSLTGVAGPLEEEGVAVGTVFIGLAIKGSEPTTVQLRLPGDRRRVREYATISSLDVLRRALDVARRTR